MNMANEEIRACMRGMCINTVTHKWEYGRKRQTQKFEVRSHNSHPDSRFDLVFEFNNKADAIKCYEEISGTRESEVTA